MTDFVYANGDTVTYADGTVVTAGHSSTAHVDTNDRVIMKPVAKLPAGVKPVGPQEVNWSHPLARGLTRALFPQNGQLLDLVNNEIITLVSGASIVMENGAEVLKFDGALSTGLTINVPATSTITVATEAWLNSAEQDHTLLSINLTNSLWWADTADGQLKHGVRFSSNNFGTNGDIPDNEWASLALTTVYSGGSNTGRTYSDGVISISADTGTYDWTSDTTYEIGAISDGNRDADGQFKYYYFWNRVLSDAEIKLIAQDPYQFLKSPVPQTQIITTPQTANDRVWVI